MILWSSHSKINMKQQNTYIQILPMFPCYGVASFAYTFTEWGTDAHCLVEGKSTTASIRRQGQEDFVPPSWMKFLFDRPEEEP